MSFIPNTTCRRCHRQYPSFRNRCPYCGTKKTREVRSAVPETDSAVPGTRASKAAAEALNMQMLIGGGLLLAVMVLAIVIVSSSVHADVSDHESINSQIQANQTNNTPVPLPTSTPEPTATPAPLLQKIEVRWGTTGVYDYVSIGFFSMPAGSTIPLAVLWSPATVHATPEWSVDDDSIVQITPNESGMQCDAKMVGEPGQSTVLHVKVNEKEADITVNIS